MSQPVKNAEGATFQLAMLTAAGLGEVQCIALVGADGQPITAWPLPTGAATDSKLNEILTKLPADPATAAGVAAIVTRLGQPLTVNHPADFPDAASLAKAEQIRVMLGSVATQATLAQVLAALQATLTVAVQAFPADYPDATSLAKLEQLRTLLAGTLAVSGPLTDTQLRATPVQVSTGQAEDTPAVPGAQGFVVLGVRNDSDAPTADDGDWTWLKLDEEGRLKVATKPASITPTVGDLAALNSAIACDVRRASNVVFHLKNTGTATMAAGTFVFEASLDSTNGTDGTWFGVQAARSNANTAATSVAITSLAVGAGDAYAWEASVNGYRWFRVRCSVAATTNSVARWTLQPGSYATEPLPVNQVSTVTATANIGTYGGVVYTDSSANLAISAAFTGTIRDAGSTVGYGVFAANAYADQAGTLYLEKSTDNTTWRPALQVAVAAATPVELKMLITTRYNRVRYVNGAVAQTAFLLTSTMQRI